MYSSTEVSCGDGAGRARLRASVVRQGQAAKRSPQAAQLQRVSGPWYLFSVLVNITTIKVS